MASGQPAENETGDVVEKYNIAGILSRLRRGRRDERGAAFGEFAIVLPFMVMVTLGAVDVGSAVIQYYNISQAADLGLKHMIRNGRLEVATYSSPGDNTGVYAAAGCPSSGSPSTGGKAHEEVHARVRQLLAMQNPQFDIDSLCVTTTRESDPDDATFELTRIRIEITFDSFFLKQLPIVVENTGPFMR